MPLSLICLSLYYGLLCLDLLLYFKMVFLERFQEQTAVLLSYLNSIVNH